MLGQLRGGDTAVDVGAYKGGYTYWMRRAVGAAGMVLVFEPQPALAAYLRQCGRDFGWTNVLVDEAALSSAPGKRPLLVPGREPSPGASLVGASLPEGARSYEVHADTLDGALARSGSGQTLRLIKCDVEGHELDLFQGGSQTLARHRPHLLFECEERHLRSRSMPDVFGHLERLGYRGTFFLHGERRPVADFDIGTHQVEGRRPYVNNFVFEHEDGPR
jgi:FkbM family methyltransferase